MQIGKSARDAYLSCVIGNLGHLESDACILDLRFEGETKGKMDTLVLKYAKGLSESRAASVDTVDECADRRFQAGIIACRPDPAYAYGTAVGGAVRAVH